MQLLLIRHGQSEADLLGVHEGRADFPLTALGQKQAERLSTHVATNYPPEVIISSPLLRAKATAMSLREAVDCDLIIEEDLMEFNNGVLAGLSREVAAIQYPLPPNGRPPHIPIENGESELEFRLRAEKVLHKIIHDYRDLKRVAIVSHGGLISQLIKSFLSLPNTGDFIFATGDTGIHLLEIKDHVRVVGFLNRQDHL